MDKNLNKIKYSGYIIAFIAILFYYGTLYCYSVNIPFFDDYSAILDFIINYLDSKSLTDKLLLILSPHNEHRIAFCRLIVLLNYFITGSISFKILILFGNSCLIPLMIILFYSYRPSKNKIIFFLPAILLLFQIQYWKNCFWAMTSLGQLWGGMFAFAALYFISTYKNRNAFWYSLFFAVMAVFTISNGLLTFPVCLGVLVYKKKYLASTSWLIASIVIIGLYFFIPSDQQTLHAAAFSFKRFALFFLILLGGSAAFGNIVVSFIFGIIFVLIFIYLSYSSYFKRNLTMYVLIVFILLTCLGISYARCGMDIEQHAVNSKYRLYSSLLVLCFYLVFTEEVSLSARLRKYIAEYPKSLFSSLTAFILCMAFCSLSFLFNIDDVLARRDFSIREAYNWSNSEDKNDVWIFFPDQQRIRTILYECQKRNIYKFPTLN